LPISGLTLAMNGTITRDVLSKPLRYLKGVGPRRGAELERVGLATVEDFLCRFPLRYEDRSQFLKVTQLRPGEAASVEVEIITCGLRATRRPGFRIFEALVGDASGSVRVVWLNQPFLRDVLAKGQRVVLYGSVDVRGGVAQLTNPQFEIIQRGEEDEAGGDGEATIHTGRIVPVYGKAGSLTSKMQRTLVRRALDELEAGVGGEAPAGEPLPDAVRRRRGLPGRLAAMRSAHFPDAGTNVDELNRFRAPGQVRLIFEEFFLFQVGLVLRRREMDAERKPRAVMIDDRIRQSALEVLPFRLTVDQKAALAEIVRDMQRPQPMNRLLQGDVGSGKTIVALLAALVAMENGLQVAFMAPTEILADQHYLSIRRLLEVSRFRVELLTGATPLKRKRELQAGLADGSIHLVIGTHALVQDPLVFNELGLVIIDEQHRFGVLQRAGLRAKGLHPDVLVMTATPIPRTLALTTYGDLDSSTIREMPPGRRPIKTVVKPESRRDDILGFVREELDRGRQAYVVYPLVEESSKTDLGAATEMCDHLARDVFSGYRVALLHGRMKQETKDQVMGAFARGECQVLVSTTVVEVGVDVPNASVMVVEHAERFGLAQLHQLRGRVGRGPHQSYCILLYQPPLSEQGRARLGALEETTDGFVIAERDLELRGPGDFVGTRQWGVPTLRVGDLLRDHAIMEEARREAVVCLDEGGLAGPLSDWVRQAWAERFGLVGIG
jgi:ATP-dependent DNA helicase RecG